MSDISDKIKNLLPENVTEPKSHAELMKHKSLTEKAFPHVRMRRLRQNPAIRNMVQENHLTVNDLIYPIFVEEDIDEPVAIKTMPGVVRETEKTLQTKIKEVQNLPSCQMTKQSYQIDNSNHKTNFQI